MVMSVRSVLSYICDYGDSEDSESEQYTEIPKTKLPQPCLDGVRTVKTDDHVDDPQLHDGRTRTFPHVRGNWATFVYVDYPENQNLKTFIKRVETVCRSVCAVEHLEDLHVSLSRTVVLKFHMIPSFNASLKQALLNLPSFQLDLDTIKVYCNEDESRTFVALQVDHFSNKYLLQITKNVDKVLKEFSLPVFYENPSFHASFLWTNGNKKVELEEALKDLLDLRNQLSIKSVLIEKVHSRIGNRLYQYSLE